jgi:hypothetical protein
MNVFGEDLPLGRSLSSSFVWLSTVEVDHFVRSVVVVADNLFDACGCKWLSALGSVTLRIHPLRSLSVRAQLDVLLQESAQDLDTVVIKYPLGNCSWLGAVGTRTVTSNIDMPGT